jgi:hypothetical protein
MHVAEVLMQGPSTQASPELVEGAETTLFRRALRANEFVYEAPIPRFARLKRADDRVLRGVEMFRSVAVFRIVAAADVAAGLTQAQVHPLIAHLQALLAAFGRARLCMAGIR